MVYNANLNIIIIGIYRPPRADDNSFKLCLQKIDEFIRKHEGADIQMTGDLNLRFIDWNTRAFTSSSLLKSETSCAHNLFSFMDTHMLNQLVTEFTRKDK